MAGGLGWGTQRACHAAAQAIAFDPENSLEPFLSRRGAGLCSLGEMMRLLSLPLARFGFTRTPLMCARLTHTSSFIAVEPDKALEQLEAARRLTPLTRVNT